MKQTKILPPLSTLHIEDWAGPSDVCDIVAARPVSHRVNSRRRNLSRDAELQADRCIERAFRNLKSSTMS